MLTPAHPDRRDPRFKDKQARFRRDQEHKRSQPADWGVWRPGPAGPPAEAPGASAGPSPRRQR